jgi:ribonuclease P protein subunit RPR2
VIRLLLCDRSHAVRRLARLLLAPHPGIEVVGEAANGFEAVERAAALAPDVVLLDVALPVLDAVEATRRIRELLPATRVVVHAASDDLETVVRMLEAGASAHCLKGASAWELERAIVGDVDPADAATTAESAAFPAGRGRVVTPREVTSLLRSERKHRGAVRETQRETIARLSAVLQSKDGATGTHSQRVQRYALELALAVEPKLLAEESVEHGFLRHDVGKIGIPDRVLLKPGALTPGERRLMETHSIIGEQLLSSVAVIRGEGLRVVRSHHERWDGRGYPDGLRADEIPLGARIFAVADTLDAMTSDRPYRAAVPWDAAVAEIVAQAGRQFDPAVVDAFRAREHALRRNGGALERV